MKTNDWWRVLVSMIGFWILLVLLAMALKELYLKSATATVRALLVALPWLLGFVFAWIVVTSDTVPWPGDED